MWQNSEWHKSKCGKKNLKCDITKNSKCDITKKNKMRQNLKTNNFTNQIKYSKCDNSKTQNVTKVKKNSEFDNPKTKR